MNHPNHDEWIPYLFGEATPEQSHALSQHLQICPACAAQIAGWKRSLKRLDAWQVPKHAARASTVLPFAKLAAAALLTLGLGLGFGMWINHRSESARIRAEIESNLRSTLAIEIRDQLERDVAAQLQNALAATVTSTSMDLQRGWTSELNTAVAATLHTIQQARQEDQAAVIKLIHELQTEVAGDYLSLRKDLETVASLTDDEIRQARQKIFQLTALTRASTDDRLK